MKKKKTDLNEDIKRFKLLLEYDFYIGEDDEQYNPEGDEIITEEPPADDSMEGGDELPEPEAMEGGDELPEPEPMEDEVELDITQLVQGTEEAKASSDMANNKIEDLMHKFDALTHSLNKMAAINDKIDNLEREVEKRNPLPKEKLEMRSLNSYPYNLKLTDYWSEKEGRYDIMNNNDEDKEYILTQKDVNSDYNDSQIKDSF